MAKVQPHFDEAIRPQVLDILRAAKYSIRLAMYTLTDSNLFDAILQKAQNGVHVEILLDSGLNEQTANLLSEKALKLLEANSSIFLFENTRGKVSIMHNKFCVVDERLLLTGSYNWTNNAANYSNENIVIIEEASTASSYLKEFNQLKDKAILYTQNVELPIYFTVSRNIVQRQGKIEVKWSVPTADKVLFNDQSVGKTGTRIIQIDETQDFILDVSKGDNSYKKSISVKAVDKPIIVRFECSPSIIRLGQSADLIWKVTGDVNKVVVEPLGEVKQRGAREVIPTSDALYKLIVHDFFGNETSQDLILRVPDFKVPDFEIVKIILPEVKFSAKFEIQKPKIEIKKIRELKNEISLNQPLQSIDFREKASILKSNQKGFDKKIKKNIRKKKAQIKIHRIKYSIISHTENILNEWLTKIRNIK